MNTNNPVELEARINYLRRQYRQTQLDRRLQANPVRMKLALANIVSKGKWAVNRLAKLNAKVAAETSSIVTVSSTTV